MITSAHSLTMRLTVHHFPQRALHPSNKILHQLCTADSSLALEGGVIFLRRIVCFVRNCPENDEGHFKDAQLTEKKFMLRIPLVRTKSRQATLCLLSLKIVWHNLTRALMNIPVWIKSEYVIYISNALLSNDWRVAPPKEGKPPGSQVSHTDIIPCLIKSFIKPVV